MRANGSFLGIDTRAEHRGRDKKHPNSAVIHTVYQTAARIVGLGHVYQNTDVEINPRPSLVLGYEYINDAGINTLPQEVRKLNIAVVNSRGETVSRADILKNQMTDYRPLYGVPEGQYTVITFGNADSTLIVDGMAMLDNTKIYASTDELFHKIEHYDVRRGVAKLRTISLEKLAEFPLSDYLNDSKSGIDLLNGRDITIPIELDITTVGISIIINDWLAAVTQWEHIGN